MPCSIFGNNIYNAILSFTILEYYHCFVCFVFKVAFLKHKISSLNWIHPKIRLEHQNNLHCVVNFLMVRTSLKRRSVFKVMPPFYLPCLLVSVRNESCNVRETFLKLLNYCDFYYINHFFLRKRRQELAIYSFNFPLLLYMQL